MRFTRRFCFGAIVLAAAVGTVRHRKRAKRCRSPGLLSPPVRSRTVARFLPNTHSPARIDFAGLGLEPRSGKHRAFVLIMHDPEAVDHKMTEDHLHWMLLNIPATVHELPEGVPATPTLADGTIQCKNVGGTVGYRGPGARRPRPVSPLHLGNVRARYQARLGPGCYAHARFSRRWKGTSWVNQWWWDVSTARAFRSAARRVSRAGPAWFLPSTSGCPR